MNSIDDAVSGRALAVAVTVATAVPIVLINLGFALAFDSFIPRSEDAGLLMFFSITAVFVAMFAVVVFVLPLHWLLARGGWGIRRRVIASGTLGALPASGLWLILQSFSNDPLSSMLVAAWPITLFAPGLLGVTTYCLVCRRRTKGA